MSKRLGIIIDQERCIGCEACSIACRIENQTSLFYINVETQGGAKKDRPNGSFPDLTLNFLPKLCNHCDDPPCVDSCPVDALVKQENGIVFLDQEICTGCQACIAACPYGVIAFNEVKNIAEKCNLCSHRIEEGLEPFCVICCEGQAMHFGDFSDNNSEVSKILSKSNHYQLKPEAQTNPSVYYLPPKPKKNL